MSSAKWRPFCLGLNVFNFSQYILYKGHETSYDSEMAAQILDFHTWKHDNMCCGKVNHVLSAYIFLVVRAKEAID